LDKTHPMKKQLQSLVCGTSSGLSGYPHPHRALRLWPSRFPAGPWGPPRTTVPRAMVKKRGSSSRGLDAPLVFHRATLAGVPRDSSTSLGVPLPHRGIRKSDPLTREAPTPPATFRPQGFSPSRRLTPRSPLRPCFMPQPRPGFALQGFSLPSSRTRLSTGRSLLPSGSPRLPIRKPAPAPRAPTSGLVATRESVASSTGVTPYQRPIPSWASPPSGSLSTRDGNGFPPPPPMSFGLGPFTLIPWPALRSVARERPGLSLSRPPTRSRFLRHAVPTN
jgi:hypothetical protein